MATGRTTSRNIKIQIEDAGGVLRDVPVSSLGSIGLVYEEVDVSAIQEIVKSFLNAQAGFSVSISGPFDNKAAVVASASGEDASAHLSGSLTVLDPLNGKNTPRAFALYVGILAAWSTGDPVFGADNCVVVSEFTHDPVSGSYSCKLVAAGGGTPPAWGTTAITVA
jgi:hypothetical protein